MAPQPLDGDALLGTISRVSKSASRNESRPVLPTLNKAADVQVTNVRTVKAVGSKEVLSEKIWMRFKHGHLRQDKGRVEIRTNGGVMGDKGIRSSRVRRSGYWTARRLFSIGGARLTAGESRMSIS